MQQTAHQIVLTTCPDADSAQTIAETLVNEGLAACVSILPEVRSIYRWQGGIARDTEQQLIIKTSSVRFAALRQRLVALHPYELPELVAVPIVDGLPDYLNWLSSLD